ncbi:MAG TPA: hypothetical protein VJQ82_13925, partial [Terriglobales bacterium]|nr:hypothetical protein [Terriglobales bacterium]
MIPERGWSRHKKGYLIYTSRKKGAAIKRGQYLHRAVVEDIGIEIPPGMHVQHLYPFDKTTRDPAQLMISPPEFNPSSARRCPYTGQFLSPAEWERR